MFAFLQNALYLGGGVATLVLLFLPTVFLLAVSAAYVVFELVQLLRRERDAL